MQQDIIENNAVYNPNLLRDSWASERSVNETCFRTASDGGQEALVASEGIDQGDVLGSKFVQTIQSVTAVYTPGAT
jgi:hypothetical protein